MSYSVPVIHTVVSIKNYALRHRFNIEPRTQEASFEIVKERRVEFGVEMDTDVLYELLGNEIDSLTKGPVWTYVLERKRVVGVWNTLMGNIPTPSEAGEYAGNANASTINESSRPGGKPSFKTCAIPATNSEPDIVPRMSLAAALRITGSTIPDRVSSSKPRAPLTKERLAQTFTNDSGHNPIALCMTKLAALRTAKDQSTNDGRPGLVAPRLTKRLVTDGTVSATEKVENARTIFGGIPGHKRHKTISVASVKLPTVTPRSNKSATLRQNIAAPPSSLYGTAVPTPLSWTSSMDPVTVWRQSAPTTTSTLTRRASSAPGTTRRSYKPRQRPSSGILPPTITPRTNESAVWRVLKKAPKRSKPLPSSFKPSTVAA
ncbi:hypothetical protein P691DRAFT_792901 [Macrolepiota fuliginosa MF-IS2]|uniref:Nucleoside diphosphate kinase n=1 Tax=Macrolepiota fuliginosa MF-IS2 TaxID=1400762 RepID=A0A9P5WZU9_9AGAR|nr:hypothetical protein P691DRAFT_792901 [Macrolepiota fuliginosa MF-IS2]